MITTKAKIFTSSIVLFVALTIIAIGISMNNNKEDDKKDKTDDVIINTKLLELDKYKDIKLENIDSITMIRYTVGGDNKEEISDKSKIEEIYNGLKDLTIIDDKGVACEDNTTVYVFNLKNDTKPSISFDCGYLDLNNKRYSVK